MSDKALAAHIGAFIRYHRLNQNITQNTLSHSAGISRSTLSLLERGDTVTMATLIQVLRVLDQLHVMEVFKVDRTPSPLSLVKMHKNIKQRARQKENPTRKDGKSS
ncbi:MAG: helix-turn-helix transcriptional regulator [Bacteroidota bacterium]|nr:helix-turn-helix transcriptional regulator [Bacteroidota bacterium]